MVCVYRYEVGWAEYQANQEWFVYKDMRWDGRNIRLARNGLCIYYRYEVGWVENQVSQE